MVYEKIPAIAYCDPWNISLSQRIKMLSSGEKRVAYFYERPDNSTFRYRVYNMVQVLNETPGIESAAYFFLDDLHCIDVIADKADLLVVCRVRYENRVNQLITAFHVREKKVIFDIDDFVFDSDYVHLILRTLDQDPNDSGTWDHWFAYISRLGATLRLCDAAITTNEFLAHKIENYAGIPVSVVPNFMNREQLEISNQVYAAKHQSEPHDLTRIVLGYFSGSPSHNNDFAIVAPALASLLQEDSRLNLVIVGYIQAGKELKQFQEKIKWYPFHDFINLQRLVGSVNFNLMPLQYNAFTNSKSELKYFEAAIVGTLSIASPTYTYAKSISHGNNGYLASAHEWATCIRQAIENSFENLAMSKTARNDARIKYSWFNQRENILMALGIL